MAQRHIQLFRNGAPATNTAFTTHAKVVEHLLGENSPLRTLDVKDGELVLYRYKLYESNDIHTIVLAASVTGTDEKPTKTFEVVANYDHLTNLITDLDATVRGTSDGTVSAIDTEFKVSETTGAYVAVEVVEKNGIITAVNVKENIDDTIKTAIEALDGDATIATVTNGVVTLKAGIVEADGIIRNSDATNATDIKLAKVATTGEAADVTIADEDELYDSINVEDALAEVMTKVNTVNAKTITPLLDQAVQVNTVENGNTTIGLKLDANEKVLTQNYNDGLKTNLDLTYDSTAKAIKLWGISSTEPIATVDATNFIKDGILADATIVPGTWAEGEFTESETGAEKAIKFVWKTYQQGQTGQEEVLKTEFLNVESLVDAYTAGNEWVVINTKTNKISHKEQSGLPTAAQGIVEAVTGTGAYAETKTFKVPQLTVDAAGHVTAVNEKEVSITLPAKQVASDVAITTITGIDASNVQAALEELQGDINAINAVNWTGDAEIEVNNDAHTITHTAHTVTVPTLPSNALATKKISVPQLTVNAAGHVTAVENVEYTIDCNVTTVSGTAEQIVVTPSSTESSEDINYTVSLAAAPAALATNDDNYANDTTTHTRISDIQIDNYGRVTNVTKTTVTEDIDAGTY